jgi:nitrogen fixation/metabolism regulation signal transduction histidine kinase
MRIREFNIQLVLRVSVLFVSLLLLAIAIVAEIRNVVLLILLLAIVLQVAGLVRFVNRTNRELESFLAGLKFGDFQLTYSIAHLGPSFRKLEAMLRQTVEKFKQERVEKQAQAVYNQVLVEHIPIPFFIVHADKRIEVLNNATRRAFNVADITNTGELVQFGAGFQRDVLQIGPGEALLTTVDTAGTRQQVILTATEVTSAGNRHKLVALQNVQSEIDATELATWQNLLRVTSHEILNSLAPVSSCAQTAKTLVDDVIDAGLKDPGLEEDMRDVQESLETVLRRSEGLKRFIQSYRQLSRLPPPNKTRIAVADYFQHLEALVKDELTRKDILLEFHHHPGSLVLAADRDMLDQVVINLIRNAADALAGSEAACVNVSAFNDSKQRTVLEIRDNGPGIPQDVAEKMFLPFFTTRDRGSGIGLALVRYIMLSHGGTVLYEPVEGSGSSFKLVF